MAYTRRRLVGGLGATLTLSLSGCLDSLGPPHSRDELEAEYAAAVETTDDNDFVPATVTIRVGESVVWFNNGQNPHTVTAYEDRIPDDAEFFDSGDHESEGAAKTDNGTGILNRGDTYGHRFEVPGTYEYYCIPHERKRMKGTVVVEE